MRAWAAMLTGMIAGFSVLFAIAPRDAIPDGRTIAAFLLAMAVVVAVVPRLVARRPRDGDRA